MKKLFTFFMATALVGSLSGQAFANDKEDEKNMRYETMKIEFDKNSSALNAESRNKLRSKVQALKQGDRLEQITIAGYSDQAFPPKANQKLTDRDEDLADKRIDAVKEAISDLEGIGIDVEAYNLAENPNPVERWLETSDYKLKSSIKGNNTEETPRHLSLIKDEGKTQSALVVFKVKQSSEKYSE